MAKITMEVVQDLDPMSPREYENLGVMVCFHRNYNFNETDLKEDYFDGWGDLKAHLQKEEEATHILPVYMYSHGNIALSTSRFSCPWDSGQIGFIYTTKEKVKKFMGENASDDQVFESMKGELKAYSQYVSGDIWGYVIYEEKTCNCCNHTSKEEIDSCFGFYGYEDAENEGKASMQCYQP